MEILRGERIKSTLCTKGIYGNIYVPNTMEDIAKIVANILDTGGTYHVKGGSSNTLFCGDEDGLLSTEIIDMRKFSGISIDRGTSEIVVGGAKPLIQLSREVGRLGYSGLEFACGIPGQVGGGIVTAAEQPRSLYNSLLGSKGLTKVLPDKVSDILKEVTVVSGTSGEIEVISVDKLKMKDRSSIFQDRNDIIVSAKFTLEEEDSKVIQRYAGIIMQSRLDIRARNSQINPYTKKNLGYAFVAKHSSYGDNDLCSLIKKSDLPDIIEHEGMVHYKGTPGIICNKGYGKPSGYIKIVDTIKDAVLQSTGIELVLEIDIVK